MPSQTEKTTKKSKKTTGTGRKQNEKSSAKSTAARSSKKRRRYTLSAKGWIVLTAAAAVLLLCLYSWQSRPDAIDRLSLTYLDNLNRESLAYEIPASYEQQAPVSDAVIYGESLVLYKNAYDPQNNDPYYGHIVMLKNLETGSQTTTTLTGGADGGIDLGAVEPGVYEIYIYDDYTLKRAVMDQAWTSEVFTTMRRNKEVNRIQIDAGSDYLQKFGIDQDADYLYLTVSSSLPKVKIADVMIDPSGLIPTGYEGEEPDPGYTGDWVEASESYSLALRIQELLEQSGLRCALSRSEADAAGYAGSEGRAAKGYDSQAKIFLSLTMDDQETDRPYLLSSPFSNGALANQIAWDLSGKGIELATVSSLPQLNPGTGYDGLLMNADYSASPFSFQAALRETGGKTTSAGALEGWQLNSPYSQQPGMNGVIFCYASSQSAASRQYYLEHKEEIAQGIAQGILDYAHIPAAEPKEDAQ